MKPAKVVVDCLGGRLTLEDNQGITIGRLPINRPTKPDIFTLISKDCIDHTNILSHNVID